MRIAVIGAAFNPPTLGHKSVIEQCLARNQFDKLLLVPAIAHVFGKEMAPFTTRVKLLELFLKDLNQASDFNEKNIPIEINYCEERLYKQALEKGELNNRVCTYDVLKALKKTLGNAKLTFVIGPDNEKLLPTFKHAKALQEEFDILTVKEDLPIRSTLLRKAIKDNQTLSQYTTESVAQYLPSVDYYAK